MAAGRGAAPCDIVSTRGEDLEPGIWRRAPSEAISHAVAAVGFSAFRLNSARFEVTAAAAAVIDILRGAEV
jgi:hypothetical protein